MHSPVPPASARRGQAGISARPGPAGTGGSRLSPRVVRWTGLAASGLTAVTAWLGGAGFSRGEAVDPATLFGGDRGFVLPVCWALGTALFIAAWWAGRTVVPSTRWAVTTAGLWLLPVLPFLPLGSEDAYSYACQGYVQLAGGDPYAVGVQQFGCPWLDSVATTWRDTPAPYGPLFLLLAAFAVQVGDTLAGTVAALRVIAVAGVAITAAALPVLARHAGVDPARATWVTLACPLVAVHLVSGTHNDALMLGLLVAGLAVVATSCAGRERRPTLWLLIAGGALLGLAVAVKATAVVVVPFAVLVAAPPGSAVRALWRPGVAVAGATAGALAAVSLVAGRGFGWIAGLARSGVFVEWTSPSTAVGMTVNYLGGLFGQRWHAVPVTRLIGMLMLTAVLIALWWRARRGNALLGAGLALAATVALAPVFHPWYAMWPLAVLAATWTGTDVLFARWLLIPVSVAATLTLPAGYNLAHATKPVGAPLMTAATVLLAILAVRRRAGTATASHHHADAD